MILHFISDLHLDEQRPGIEIILLAYLENMASQADALYLLGDIFEFWLGDDISLPRYEKITDALKHLSGNGTQIFFMRGNRDFLVGDGFSSTTGCQILNDPTSIRIGNIQTLISHGDYLCTDDVEHQKFRELVSQPEVRQRLLSLPIEQRENMAQQLRSMSKSGNSMKASDIMDVSQDTVLSEMKRNHARLLIHGHTHRCAIHDFNIDGNAAQRVVLADWHENAGNVLVANDAQLEFITLC